MATPLLPNDISSIQVTNHVKRQQHLNSWKDLIFSVWASWARCVACCPSLGFLAPKRLEAGLLWDTKQGQPPLSRAEKGPVSLRKKEPCLMGTHARIQENKRQNKGENSESKAGLHVLIALTSSALVLLKETKQRLSYQELKREQTNITLFSTS
uniref:Uncharacterized protein n=1 Tax=Pipistrellus kuhlii TaxID=59472 RepID=A0A7J7X0P5_PIPKU|nr:hypothetical protein mPipKuh1_010756 [Pipistrellus kuhlii]